MEKKKQRLIVASNRLPFYKFEDANGTTVWKKGTGGLITALDPVLRQTNGIWLGWDGSTQEHIDPNAHIDLIDMRTINADPDFFVEHDGSYSIVNVPITEKELDEYYNRLSNSTLWALFHYFFEQASLDYEAWNTYYEVNYRFAKYINSLAQPQDIVWVHDFHLFLVPYFLRKMSPTQKIHFFLHIPFPHFDIFSIIPWQKQIIESLLCCDTVGFHHKQYLKNAMEAVKIHQKSVHEKDTHSTRNTIKTHFYINPISINFERFHNTSLKPKTLATTQQIKTQHNCEKLILGVDRLDYSKGIKERMLGLEMLFTKHPELKGLITYYQLAVPSREDVEAYQTLKKEIDEMVGRINGKFSTGAWSPIYYMYKAIPFEELVALYAAADIALVTPLRDGMNLVCKEYIASHSDNDGILILSKFAGAISEIKNCLSVNPYSIDDIAATLYKAIHMPEAERRQRMIKLRKNIQSNNIQLWLERCFHEFGESHVLTATE